MGRLSRTKYLFDECVSPTVAASLKAVGFYGVTHIHSVKLTGAADTTIATICSSGGRILVTRDRKQLVNLDEIAALSQGKVRAIFLPHAMAYFSSWEAMKWFARHWDSLEALGSKLKPGEILLTDLRGKASLFDDVRVAASVHQRRERIAKARLKAKVIRAAAQVHTSP